MSHKLGRCISSFSRCCHHCRRFRPRRLRLPFHFINIGVGMHSKGDRITQNKIDTDD